MVTNRFLWAYLVCGPHAMSFVVVTLIYDKHHFFQTGRLCRKLRYTMFIISKCINSPMTTLTRLSVRDSIYTSILCAETFTRIQFLSLCLVVEPRPSLIDCIQLDLTRSRYPLIQFVFFYSIGCHNGLSVLMRRILLFINKWFVHAEHSATCNAFTSLTLAYDHKNALSYPFVSINKRHKYDYSCQGQIFVVALVLFVWSVSD